MKKNNADIEDAFDKWLKRAMKTHQLHEYSTSALMAFAWEGAVRYMTRKYSIDSFGPPKEVKDGTR